MNYNPRMGFNEQDYHLLKTHQSSGSSSKPYELVATVKKNTTAKSAELTVNVDNLNDIVVLLSVPALGDGVATNELLLQFTGDKLDKQVNNIAASKTAKTTHMITFKNTDGIYELSYSTPAGGDMGYHQQGWTAKTFNAEYNDQLGTFTQIPVNKISLSMYAPEGRDGLPVNTTIEVYAR